MALSQSLKQQRQQRLQQQQPLPPAPTETETRQQQFPLLQLPDALILQASSFWTIDEFLAVYFDDVNVYWKKGYPSCRAVAKLFLKHKFKYHQPQWINIEWWKGEATQFYFLTLFGSKTLSKVKEATLTANSPNWSVFKQNIPDSIPVLPCHTVKLIASWVEMWDIPKRMFDLSSIKEFHVHCADSVVEGHSVVPFINHATEMLPNVEVLGYYLDRANLSRNCEKGTQDSLWRYDLFRKIKWFVNPKGISLTVKKLIIPEARIIVGYDTHFYCTEIDTMLPNLLHVVNCLGLWSRSKPGEEFMSYTQLKEHKPEIKETQKNRKAVPVTNRRNKRRKCVA